MIYPVEQHSNLCQISWIRPQEIQLLDTFNVNNLPVTTHLWAVWNSFEKTWFTISFGFKGSGSHFDDKFNFLEKKNKVGR